MKLPVFFKHKVWRSLLIWVGPCLLTTGFVILGLGQGSRLLAGLFVGVGGLITLVAVEQRLGIVSRLSQRRSAQVGTNAIAATVAMVVILGCVNVLAVRFGVQVDVTETQLFTLSPQTETLVESLSEPLTVWIFEPVPDSIDQTLLKNYSRLNPNFRYVYADPATEVSAANRFGVEVIGEVHLEYGRKTLLIQTLRQEESLSELQITNGIEKILRDRQPHVYFLQGHGELPLDPVEGGLYQAVTSLEEKGYQVSPLDLAVETQIPPDATVLVVASPERALFEGEVDAIATYLDEGGSVFVLLDPETFSGLEPLLADWGIELDGRLVIDASGAGNAANLGPATPIVTQYGGHPITLDFQNGISFYPLAQAIRIDDAEDVIATPLAITSAESWAEQNVSSETLEFDPDEDLEGPLNLGVALTQTVEADRVAARLAELDRDNELLSLDDPLEVGEELGPEPDAIDNDAAATADEDETPDEAETDEEDEEEDEEDAEPEARLVVFGNATFATNGWFEQQLNGDMFLNSVKWLADEDEQLLSIRPKTLENRRIILSVEQSRLLGWLAVIVFPALGFMMAGVIWWQRR
ncbi:Gldg family protein [Spirulina major CS-329]|uniref:GldG family protein n=1 Tax=Spirulina TaxID=1154 RepID=UPI00232AA5BE|nr:MULTISPECIES: DUF4350 domain-containing protein [Spirulina]MDB9496785.1 Gldg family protein [Spirulina subsalsa CS-330]MDB9502400.1 Gldg family protein [Spirulina major CS-329]